MSQRSDPYADAAMRRKLPQPGGLGGAVPEVPGLPNPRYDPPQGGVPKVPGPHVPNPGPFPPPGGSVPPAKFPPIPNPGPLPPVPGGGVPPTKFPPVPNPGPFPPVPDGSVPPMKLPPRLPDMPVPPSDQKPGPVTLPRLPGAPIPPQDEKPGPVTLPPRLPDAPVPDGGPQKTSLTAPGQQTATAPAQPVQTSQATTAPDPADPFASMGGGVKLPSGDWVPRDHPLAQQATAAATGGTTGGVDGAPATPESAYKDALLRMLSDTSEPSLDDPALKAQSDAFAVQQTRAKGRAREALAERRAGSGQLSDLASSGAFDRDLVGLEQAQGESMAGHNAGLLGGELQAKRQQLLAAMGMAGQDMNADQARQLQERLAQLDAAIRREGITQQGALGGRELDLRDKLGSGGLNMQLLQLLSGNQNFSQQLGAQLGMFGANLNQNALLAMLGQLQ